MRIRIQKLRKKANLKFCDIADANPTIVEDSNLLLLLLLLLVVVLF